MEKNNLLEFVPPNFSNDATALVIESEEFLEELRELMPDARIAFLSTENSPLCKKFKIDYLRGDYTRGGLPTDLKIFDVIIAKDCLTFAPNVYVTLLEINHLLKDSGFLLTEFFNVRFAGVLESLKRGEFPAREKKFWAKNDVVKILDDAVYKEIRFLPGEKLSDESFVKSWEKFGFENFNEDLLTKIWLIKARKCTAEVVALKEIYTEEIRAKLSRLLHRVEYRIDVEENLKELKEFCRRENIFYEYLSDFTDQVVIHKDAARFIKSKFFRGKEF